MKNNNLRYIVFLLIVISISISYGQKKKPTRTTAVPQDSTLIMQEKPEATEPTDPGLPTIDLKEHTIVGEKIITDVPTAEKTTDKSNLPAITVNPTGEGKGNRWIKGAGGIKMDQSIFYPTTSISNEFYVSYGRFDDINAGIKLRKQYIDDELFLDMDYRYNGGHLENADYYNFRNTLTNIHRFNRFIQNKTQFNVTDNTYKFYGALVDPDEERSRINFDVSTTTGVTGWEKANIRWDAGLRYMDPDETQLFNWGMWSTLNIGNTVGKSYLTTKIDVFADRIEVPLNPDQLGSLYNWLDNNRNAAPIKYLERVRDDITNNSLLSDAFHGNFSSTIEHVFGRNLKVKAGINVTYHINNNEHGLVIDEDELPPQDELTTIYPILGLEFNLGPMGSIFGNFEPDLKNVSLMNTLDQNPYVSMSAPLSYNDMTTNLKIGWKRSGTYDLSFETYYNYRYINNYGIIVPRSSGSTDENFGRWDIVYNNDVAFHEARAMLNWGLNEQIALWSSLGYKFYEIDKSEFADQIPYLPNFDLNFVLRALPGYGIEIMLNGQLVSEQFTLPWDADTGDEDKLDAYFLTNLSISKKIGKRVEIYGQVNNILNSEYEIYKGYVAPEINGWGGIKIFW